MKIEFIITFVIMLMLMMLTHLVGALPLHLRFALLALFVKHSALDLKVVDHSLSEMERNKLSHIVVPTNTGNGHIWVP